ncbi:RHS repeat-associated core domain-containing protein [Chloroflexi bacterium TSY]|nr:RHS repeat-associated core domain-containing protein [Chloroflexi bacterium TSY]
MELVDGTATQLICDGDNLIAEYRDANLLVQYVHDDGIDRPIQIAAEGKEHWYLADLVGSVRLLTASVGSASAFYRYEPFGAIDNDNTDSGGIHNQLRYTGRRLDAVLDTYDYRARQYDPILGRFLQCDPADMVDGTNLYTYTNNNPLVFSDPSGTDARPEQEHPSTQTKIARIQEAIARREQFFKNNALNRFQRNIGRRWGARGPLGLAITTAPLAKGVVWGGSRAAYAAGTIVPPLIPPDGKKGAAGL